MGNHGIPAQKEGSHDERNDRPRDGSIGRHVLSGEIDLRLIPKPIGLESTRFPLVLDRRMHLSCPSCSRRIPCRAWMEPFSGIHRDCETDVRDDRLEFGGGALRE